MARGPRGVMSALVLAVFSYQAVCGSVHPCSGQTAQDETSVAPMAGMEHMPGMAMPDDGGAPGSRADHAPNHRADCGSLAMLGGCSACSLPSLASVMAVSPGEPPVAPVAYRSHLRPRSIDVSPDVPPPRA